MAWTATLDTIDRLPNGDVRLNFRFQDGAKVVTDRVVVQGTRTPAWIADFARRRIVRIQESESFADGVQLGLVDLTLPLDPRPPLTPEQIARRRWATKYGELQGFEAAIAAGLDVATNPIYVALRADVVATRLPGYEDLY